MSSSKKLPLINEPEMGSVDNPNQTDSLGSRSDNSGKTTVTNWSRYNTSC
jgi:hypothetical protein